MTADKRNIYLDVEESDDDDVQGYDSEADELKKGDSSRNAKRRKLEEDVSSDEDDDDDDDEDAVDERLAMFEKADTKELSKNNKTNDKVEEAVENKFKDKATSKTKKRKHSEKDESGDKEGGNDGGNNDDGDDDDDNDSKKHKKSKKSTKPKMELKIEGGHTSLAKRNLVITEKAIRKSGVVYLSRVPPFMKPAKLRSLLEPYGKVNRIFLSPEDPQAHTRRVRSGGNKKRSFVDGWVEFVRKKDAQAAVDLLNAHTIGGKKGTFYRDDIWNLTYLRGFKWHHLTEQIAQENAERDLRLQAELKLAKEENEEFLENVQRAKMLDGMEAKKLGKQMQQDGDDGGDADTGKAKGGDAKKLHRRVFKQTPLAKKKTESGALPAESVQRVLSKIF